MTHKCVHQSGTESQACPAVTLRLVKVSGIQVALNLAASVQDGQNHESLLQYFMLIFGPRACSIAM